MTKKQCRLPLNLILEAEAALTKTIIKYQQDSFINEDWVEEMRLLLMTKMV